jgi:hypothetical protein
MHLVKYSYRKALREGERARETEKGREGEREEGREGENLTFSFSPLG